MVAASLAIVLVVQTSADAREETFTTDVKGFGDIEMKAETVKLNNFTIAEDRDFMTPRGWNRVRISLSAKNGSSAAARLQLQIAGFDASGNLLWAASLEPLLGLVGAGKVDKLEGHALVTALTLQGTKKIVTYVRGDF
jgi:hypothetical protein